MEANSAPVESSSARIGIAALSIVVIAAVAVLIRILPSSGGGGLLLPTINAGLNGTAAVLLVFGYRFIRAKNIRAHRACMLAAFSASTLFLVGYVLHHAQVGSVPFRGRGLLRMLYLAFLVPHVVLAAVVVPLALFTLYRGYTGRLEAHRRIARYTLPIWLYVSVSGVIVYLMLYHLPV